MFVDQRGKPSSVVDDHLSGPAITCKLERRSLAGTALHRGKDFAVSFRNRFRHTLRESTYPFGHGRFCSHLAPRGGRALPATFLQLPACARTFLSGIHQSDRLRWSVRSYTTIQGVRKVWCLLPTQHAPLCLLQLQVRTALLSVGQKFLDTSQE